MNDAADSNLGGPKASFLKLNQQFRGDTYYKSAVDFLQDLFLVEGHGLSFPLLYPLLLQLFAGIHLACGPYLTCTHLQRTEGNKKETSKSPKI